MTDAESFQNKHGPAENGRSLTGTAGPAGLPVDFRALFDAAPTPLLVIAPPDWTIVAANDARLKVTGTTHEDTIGRKLFDAFPDDPDDPDADGVRNLTASLEHVVATRAADVMAVQRYALRDANGEFVERWWSPVNTPVLGSDGEVTAIIHRVEDVTDIVRLRGEAEASDQLVRDQQSMIDRLRVAETDLRNLSARNDEILESISDAFYAVDRDWRFTYVNRRSEEWWGRSREELIGKVYWDEFPQAGSSEVYRAHLRASKERSVVRLETVFPILGQWVDISIYPTKDGGLSVYFRDIDGKKRAEEAQRASEEFNRRILQASADCIKVLSLDARLEFMSEGGMCVMEVEDFGAINGACWIDLWAGEEHAKAVAAVEEAKGGGIGRFQGFATTMKGNPRWWDVIVSPINGPDGNPEKLLSVSRDVTSARLAEERERRTEARYRQIVEGAEDFAIVTLNEHGFITGWNSGAEHITGFSDDEAIGRVGDFYFTPEDKRLGEPDHELNRAHSDGRSLNERWHVKKDGTRFWGSGLSMRLDQPGGGYLKIFRDRTAEHEAEAAVRESEARFRLMADAVPQIVWITDAEGRAEFFNKQWSDYIGVSYQPTTAAEVTANHIHPDDQAATMLAFDEARRTGKTYLTEHRIQSATGDYRWFLVRGEPHRDPQTGEVVRWFGASIDIHDRKLAEEAVQESEARFRQIADAAPVLIWIADLSKACTWFNKPWLEFTGRTMEQEYGFGWAEGVHPDDYARCVAIYTEAFDRREPFRMDYRLRRQDGEWRIVDDRGVPRFADHGIFLGYIGACTDVTEARQAEQAIRDLNDTLEQRVGERTAELSQAQEALRQSQKLEAMGQLTGGVAHDFNNLLTPIIGSLDMLTRRGVGSERERRLIDGALQSAERAKTLVQRLLAFARRQPLQPTAVDVKRLVGGMAELIASTSGPKVDVRVELPDDLRPAVADVNQLEMAVLNLAVNARDAMPDGGVLTISAAHESVQPGHRSKLRQGYYVRLSVRDTGTGMDDATIARAVEPFFSTKGIGRGTGLGLSMVHGLALQLNGGLTISSRPGDGTTIELWLPISSVTADAEDSSLQAVRAPKALGTALLVDDEDLVRMSIADMLMDLGYEVVEASSAEEALRLVTQGLVLDLLVTDHLMPGISGAELACDLRARKPDLPVLIVSGYAEAEGIEPGLPRLTKPFRNTELAASLAALMPTAAG